MDSFEPDDDLVPPGELDVRTAALQQTVASVAARPCARCLAPLCGHGAMFAVVLGYKNRPLCAACLAADLREEPRTLAERALQWILRRDCFLHVWRAASTEEGQPGQDRPACHFATADPDTPPRPNPTSAAQASGEPAADAHWDAGDLGCGDLVLELRYRLRELPPGGVLAVTARDPAAPVDLPAWCGLCGHTLLRASAPLYFIQRKRD